MTKKTDDKTWKKLYLAAESYRKLAPWDWTFSDLIFGVRDPETGETNYCCVLGAMDEVFALVVYEGLKGLRGYLELLSGDPEDGDTFRKVMENQRVLMASFEDRRDLYPRDLKQIRDLGVTCRGRKAWPMFRHYAPGYVPWFLTTPQARILATCLEQALDLLPRYRDNPALLDSPDTGRHLVRTPGTGADSGQWHDAVLPIPDIAPSGPPKVPADEVGIARISRLGKKHGGPWEIGYDFAPMPIQENARQRPWYPRLLGIIDHRSGMIISFKMEKSGKHLTIFRDEIMAVMWKASLLPSLFLIDHDHMEAVIKPIAEGLGIPVERVSQLPGFSEAIEGMGHAMRR